MLVWFESSTDATWSTADDSHVQTYKVTLTLCRRDIRGIRGSGAQGPSGQAGQMQIVEPANGINLPLPCKGGESYRIYSPAVSRAYSTPSKRHLILTRPAVL